jgi:hypothetical protein
VLIAGSIVVGLAAGWLLAWATEPQDWPEL